MKLETLDRIKKLRSQAGSLKSYFERFNKAVSDNSSLDKYGCLFNDDHRFSNWKATVSFDSWTGYYGNSSCSTAGPSLPKEDAQLYFTRAINKHKGEIFQTMAEEMAKDAEALIKPATEELRKFNEMMQELIGESV